MLSILILITIFAVLWAQQYMKRKTLPPGPIPLPIVGNSLQFGALALRVGGIVNALKVYKKTYGPVFTIWLGPLPTVHICDLENAVDAMIKNGDKYANRWAPYIFTYGMEGLGIVSSSGRHWQDQRRFALHTLRNFGLGRDIMEERIMEEFELRMQSFTSSRKNGIFEGDPAEFVEPMIGSIINRMLFGKRFENDDKEFFELKHFMDENTADISPFVVFIKRWMTKVPGFKQYIDKYAKWSMDLREFVKRQVDERKAAVDAGDHTISDEPNDYVDAFLRKIEDDKGTDTTFSDEALIINLHDLWITGQETTTTTLLNALIHLVRNPEHVQKVRTELNSVAGGRPVTLKDKSSTPLLNSMIMEIQRLASILGLNLWREASVDSVVGGHLIPAGTTITAQISVIMSDNDLFKDAEKFDPDRYSENKKLDQNVIPFGIGKRACLGESLARAELYLVLSNLIQRFEFLPMGDLPSTEPLNSSAIFRKPRPFQMKLKPILL